MGLPFPIYAEETLKAMTSQNRAALKAALRSLWQNDPEIKDMIKNGNTLNAIRARLKEKSAELFR